MEKVVQGKRNERDSASRIMGVKLIMGSINFNFVTNLVGVG